jgi:membrane-associated phospholipid phosphatase
MAGIEAPPQPGSPRQADRMLPLGAFGSYLLLGGIFCVLATLAFAWLARGIFADKFVAVDDALIIWLHGYWGPVTDQLMLFLTTLGSTLLLGVFITLAAVSLLRYGRWIDAAGLVVAAAGSGIVNLILKAIFQRARPDLFQGPFHLTSYSFPSGHSMGSIACYGMLAFVAIRLVHTWPLKLAIIVGTALLVVGVGLSRVYFGVHYPTDVLGGFIAGGVWLAIAIGIVQAAEWHARRKSRQV